MDDLSISGVLLSSILREGATTGYAEGLVFVARSHQVKSNFVDEGECIQTSESKIIFTDYCCQDRPMSFYNSSADLIPAALTSARSSHGDKPIGAWFIVSHHGHILTPSIRQAAVHRNLCRACENRGDAGDLILILLAVRPNSGGCSQLLDVQCLAQTPGLLSFFPMRLHISSLNHNSQKEFAHFESLGINEIGTSQSIDATGCIVDAETAVDKMLNQLDLALEDAMEEELECIAIKEENDVLSRIISATLSNSSLE